jgi:hypothetical protein
MRQSRTLAIAFAIAVVTCAVGAAPATRQQSPIPELQRDHLALGGDYDPAFPTQEKLLGFQSGDRVATPDELLKAFTAWDQASDKAQLFEHARSYEGRALTHLVITSEKNMARLAEIKAGMAKLADARGTSAEERKRLVDTLPGVAWLGYSIHGPETSGADAALAVAYHLLADRSAATAKLLDDLVIVINPSVNPDGRNRYNQMLAETRGAQPNLDDQSVHHGGWWPGGRGNHYLFDLNRDSLFGVFPETTGRIKALRSWNPIFFVDGHEMGSLDTFLFSPPREPLNPNQAPNASKWSFRFADDLGAAFDARAWPYYHGEWNDDWYPGYANAYALFRGAVSFLYEQAAVAEGGVRQSNGTITSYREAVAHQAVASIVNVTTLQRNLRAVLADYAADRARVVAADGPYAKRTFAIPPSANAGRVQRFLDLAALHGFEVKRTSKAMKVDATDQLGRKRSTELPAGTLLIDNRQPEARLIAAFLEFDPKLSRKVLERERKEILKKDDSTMYDWTAWNLTMLFGLPAYTVDAELKGEALDVGAAAAAIAPAGAPAAGALFLALPGADDRTVFAAARLMERGLKLRVLDEPTTLDGKALDRGSVVAMRRDNAAGFEQVFAEVATELGLPVTAVRVGLGAGDLADIGGEHFDLLSNPRIAVIGRGGANSQDFGNLHFLLDQRIGIRHSLLDETQWFGNDLRRYNVIVLPDRGGPLPENIARQLKPWVEQGGTLIAIGRTAAQLASEKAALTAVRPLPEVLDKLEPFQVSLWREAEAEPAKLASDAQLWARGPQAAPAVPWAKAGKADKVDKDEAARRDAWQAMFMPQGAILAARVDAEHWLAYGVGETLPVLYGQHPVLLSAEPAEAPVRLGVYGQAAKDDKPAADKKDDKAARRAGWAPLPDGMDLTLRMSGLLWPEAAQRLSSATYLARERVGRGQVILFAAPPAVRAGTEGTMRLLSNALVFGPGLGAEAPVIP